MCTEILKVRGRVEIRILLIFVFLLVSPAVKVRAADEFTKVPVLVNVLKGVTMSDADIDDMIKEANKILKQAKIQLEFDKDKNINDDVNDTGNQDGNIQSGEEAKLDGDGRKELDNKFGKGKGIKIYITNEIRDDPNTRGLASHVKEKNGKLMAKPVIYIKKTTATNKSKGNDLAHECAHVFTLGKNHVIDKTSGKNADDSWHDPNDPNNLMYPYNPYAKDGNSLDRGGELTDDQIEEIKKGAKKLGKTKVAKKEKGGSSPYSAVGYCSIEPLPTIHGGCVDEIGETNEPYADIHSVFLFAETETSLLEISILTGGLIPYEASMGISIYIDNDNNIATGMHLAGFNGIDKALVVSRENGLLQTCLYDTAGSSGCDYVPGVRMERCGKILDSDEDGLPSEVTDDVDGIFIPIPTESLELVAPVVPIYITADCFDSGDHDEATFDFDSGGLPCPDFQNHTTLLRYGDPLIYSGSGFTPLSDVHILLDDTPLCTVQSDASGNINGSYWPTIPEDMATYNDFFFITARDDVSGGFDYSIIELEGNSANLNCDTIVDWTDFAIFAAEWLSPDWPSYTGYCDQP